MADSLARAPNVRIRVRSAFRPSCRPMFANRRLGCGSRLNSLRCKTHDVRNQKVSMKHLLESLVIEEANIGYIDSSPFGSMKGVHGSLNLSDDPKEQYAMIRICYNNSENAFVYFELLNECLSQLGRPLLSSRRRKAMGALQLYTPYFHQADYMAADSGRKRLCPHQPSETNESRLKSPYDMGVAYPQLFETSYPNTVSSLVSCFRGEDLSRYPVHESYCDNGKLAIGYEHEQVTSGKSHGCKTSMGMDAENAIYSNYLNHNGHNSSWPNYNGGAHNPDDLRRRRTADRSPYEFQLPSIASFDALNYAVYVNGGPTNYFLALGDVLQCRYTSYVTAIQYITYLVENNRIKITTDNLIGIATIGALVALKFGDDSYISNSALALFLNLPVATVNNLELQFVKLLDYNMFIDFKICYKLTKLFDNSRSRYLSKRGLPVTSGLGTSGIPVDMIAIIAAANTAGADIVARYLPLPLQQAMYQMLQARTISGVRFITEEEKVHQKRVYHRCQQTAFLSSIFCSHPNKQ